MVTGDPLESEELCVERSGAAPVPPDERGRDPLNEAVSSSAEYVGRTGTMGDRQQTL